MAKRMGNWLDGPSEPLPEGVWPGRGYGLPESGRGSVAPTGKRLLALLLDLLVGFLVGGLVSSLLDDPDPGLRSTVATAAFAVQLLVLQSLTGQSVGMRLAGIRVARLAQPAALPGFLPVAVRTALICLILPPLLMDQNGRGLHDKAGGTVVLRA